MTTEPDPSWLESLPDLTGFPVSVLVNARAAMPPERLDRVLDCAVSLTPGARRLQMPGAFRPSFPRPRHRMTDPKAEEAVR
jgi:hypothetical protein